MFFIGIFGFDGKVRQLRGGIGCSCPQCRQTTYFNLCKSYEYFHFFFLPLIKFHTQYIATCGSCAAVYAVEPSAAKRVASGESSSFSPQDLALVQKSGDPLGSCPHCGNQNPAGSGFCNRCGGKL